MNASTIRSVITEAGSNLVSVTFIKKDGTKRLMTFDPTDHSDIKGTGKPCTNPDIFRVREYGRDQWRSFDASRVLNIQIRELAGVN